VGMETRTDQMGPVSQEELRRAAYYVTEAFPLGHWCDDGLAERIARLADVLSRTNGWTPSCQHSANEIRGRVTAVL